VKKKKISCVLVGSVLSADGEKRYRLLDLGACWQVCRDVHESIGWRQVEILAFDSADSAKEHFKIVTKDF
jgi:hypothetical protein